MDRKSLLSSIIAAILSGTLIFISPEVNEIKDPNITNEKINTNLKQVDRV